MIETVNQIIELLRSPFGVAAGVLLILWLGHRRVWIWIQTHNLIVDTLNKAHNAEVAEKNATIERIERIHQERIRELERECERERSERREWQQIAFATIRAGEVVATKAARVVAHNGK